MLKKIIDYILSILGLRKKKTDTYSSRIQRPLNKNGVKLTIIRKEILLIKIEENLTFIDELIEALQSKGDYRTHIDKLKDLKVQSYGCTKLIKRMSENAPYYQNTLKVIDQHTTTVRELMQVV